MTNRSSLQNLLKKYDKECLLRENSLNNLKQDSTVNLRINNLNTINASPKKEVFKTQ
jgi:hypothetical protein